MRRITEPNGLLDKYRVLLDAYLTKPDANYFDYKEKLSDELNGETPTHRIAAVETVANILQAAEAQRGSPDQRARVTLLKKAFNITQADGWYAALYGRTVKLYQLNDPLRDHAVIASLRCYALNADQIQVEGFLASDWQLVYVDANTRKANVCSGLYLDQLAFAPGHFYILPKPLYQAMTQSDSVIAEQFFKQPPDNVIRLLEFKARDLIKGFTGKDRDLILVAQNLFDNLSDQERTLKRIIRTLYPPSQQSTSAPRASSYASTSKMQSIDDDDMSNGPSLREKEAMAKCQETHDKVFKKGSALRQQKVYAARDKEKQEWEQKLREVQDAKNSLCHVMAGYGFDLKEPRLTELGERVSHLKSHLEYLQRTRTNIENTSRKADNKNFRTLIGEYEQVKGLKSVAVFLDLVIHKLAFHGQIGDPKYVPPPSPKAPRSPEVDRVTPQRVPSSPVVQRQAENSVTSYARIYRDEGPSIFQQHGKKIALIGAIIGLVVVTCAVSIILHAKGLSLLALCVEQFSTAASQAILNFFGAHAALGTLADVGFGLATFGLSAAIAGGMIWAVRRVCQCISNNPAPIEHHEMPMQVLGNPIATNLDLRKRSKKSPFGKLVVANLDLRNRDEWQHLEEQPEPSRCSLFSCWLPWTSGASRAHEYSPVSSHEQAREQANTIF